MEGATVYGHAPECHEKFEKMGLHIDRQLSALDMLFLHAYQLLLHSIHWLLWIYKYHLG